MELTDKQLAFCTEYLKDSNATRAAVAAGYSPHTAHAIGHNLLQKPHIQKWISEKQEAAEEKAQITRETILEGLLKEANNKKNPAYARVAAWKAIYNCFISFEKFEASKPEPYEKPNIWITIQENGEHYDLDDHRRMVEEGIPAEPIVFDDEEEETGLPTEDDTPYKMADGYYTEVGDDEDDLPLEALEDNTPYKLVDKNDKVSKNRDSGNVRQCNDY
jgi:hypothetical protein